MADEKILKIVAKVDGNQGPSPDAQAKAYNEAAAKARVAEAKAEEARAKAATMPPADGEEGPKRRGRPRKAPWDPNGRVPPPPPKGRAGAPPLPPSDDPTSEQGKSKLAEAWKIFQKGVTAFSGANGRLTKSVAFASRGFEFAAQTVSGFNQAGITAAGTLQAVHGAAAGAAGKFGLSAAAAAKVAGVIGTTAVALTVLGIATAGATLFVVGLGAAVKGLTRVIDNMEDVVGEFSAALQAARANTRVAEIQTRMRSAQRVGGELAALENSKSSGINAIIEAKTEIVDLFSPVIKAAMDFFTSALEKVTLLLTALNVVSNGLEVLTETSLQALSSIPLIGKVAARALLWMQQDEISNVKLVNELNDKVEDLFRPEGLGFTKDSKNTVAGKFLP
jgi:hypothetical protein